MNRVTELLSAGSEAIGPGPREIPSILTRYPLGNDVFDMLRRKNGFYAFESSLHVFPAAGEGHIDLDAWNSEDLWRGTYNDLSAGLLFFAEDIFQDQFCLSPKGIVRFEAETGDKEHFADSLETWANLLLEDFSYQTGWRLASEWQQIHGPIPIGKRLMPKIPFFLGGEFSMDNLWAGESVAGMRAKGDLAIQTRNLPDGSKVTLRVGPRPERP